jgi:hypothetical protein
MIPSAASTAPPPPRRPSPMATTILETPSAKSTSRSPGSCRLRDRQIHFVCCQLAKGAVACAGVDREGEQIGRQEILHLLGDEDVAPESGDQGGQRCVARGAAGDQGHVPEDVLQRDGRARGHRSGSGRLDRAPKAAAAAGRGQRGGHC